MRIEITPTISKVLRRSSYYAVMSLIHQRRYDTTATLVMYEIATLMILRNREIVIDTNNMLELLDLSPKTSFRVHLNRTIKPAIEEINRNKHGFILSYEPLSLTESSAPGRRATTHIRLRLEIDPDNICELPMPKSMALFDLLSKWEINDELIKTLYVTHSENTLMSCYQQTLADVDSRKGTAKEIKKPSSWFLKMVQDASWSKHVTEVKPPPAMVNNRSKAAKEDYEKILKASKQKNEAFTQYLFSPIEEQARILKDFGRHLQSSGMEKLNDLFYEKGVMDESVREVFVGWLIGWKNFAPGELVLEHTEQAQGCLALPQISTPEQQERQFIELMTNEG